MAAFPAAPAKLGVELAVSVISGFAGQPEGGLPKVITHAEVDFVGWWKLIAPILLRMLKSDGEADLANLKRILETTPSEQSVKINKTEPNR